MVFFSRCARSFAACRTSSDVQSHGTGASTGHGSGRIGQARGEAQNSALVAHRWIRSEEHTSELQSQSNLVCRLLLEKKKKKNTTHLDASIYMDSYGLP